MHFSLPYGNQHLDLDLPDSRVNGVLQSGLHSYRAPKDPAGLVEDALAHPIGSPPLCELARGRDRVVLIASDHTRPVPSRVLIPPMLREIRRGNPAAQITLLIATGCHRGTTRAELIQKFGPQIVETETIVIHDCDRSPMADLGVLPSGGRCVLNRLVAQADLVVAEGFIEPHFFAGFSGGRKSVLPGVAGRATVLANHCSEFIADPHARAGVLEGNPIHRDMLWAARAAKLAFILNVVVNDRRDVLCAVAGDCEAAHQAGCDFLSSLCRVQAKPASIVISTNGGYPLDQNIYQAVKGMTAAEAAVRPGGVIIMLARSNDGHGGEDFCRQLAAEADLARTQALFLSRGRDQTAPDQWQTQILIRVLLKARVVYLSDADDQLVRSLHMIPAHSLPQALDIAQRLVGDAQAPVTVIPDGVAVMVAP